jgi:N-dimethylarginine dimethylaminohydrolase
MLSHQTILLCPPDYFAVDYVINPWMQDHVGATQPALAKAQWQALYDVLRPMAALALQPAQPGLPDLVFTANAGLVYGDLAIVSRFRNPERQGETPHDAACFRELGFQIADWPEDVTFEGAGDALFDRAHPILWLGFGFRSDPRAATLLRQLLPRVTVEVLELVDPRFYHLDTCFCPLHGGYVLYYPPAFSAASQQLIQSRISGSMLIAVSEADALGFACNAVNIEQNVVLNQASPELRYALQSAGLTPHIVPLGEFMQAGGAAKCLTLKLFEPAV